MCIGFEGDNCEVDIDECADAPCENDGECFEKSNPELWETDWEFTYATAVGYVCQCQPGYTGTSNIKTNVNVKQYSKAIHRQSNHFHFKNLFKS